MGHMLCDHRLFSFIALEQKLQRTSFYLPTVQAFLPIAIRLLR